MVVTLAAVLARIVWVFPATYLPRALFRGIRKRDPSPRWQVPAVISWSGMRGVVTLAAAFAIPPEVPGRETIVFLAFFVTVATLLLHGLTLPAVIRRLGVQRDASAQADVLAEAQAQHDAVQAAIARLDELIADDAETAPPGTSRRSCAGSPSCSANSVWEQLGRPDVRDRGEPGGGLPAAAPGDARRRSATRSSTRRDAGEIDDEVLRRVLRQLDLEEAMLDRDAVD